MDEKLINEELCSKCEGMCCKKSGCDYGIDNFEKISIDYLQKELESGLISIVSCQDFKKLSNGKIINNPFLYLRARNINRPVVDLLSFKTTCASLTNKGCIHNSDTRPKGGLNLIPSDNWKNCVPLKEPIEIVKGWNKYQNILNRLVKRITGNTVLKQMSIDAENIIYDCLSNNFDNISKIEIQDVLEMIPLLVKCYPEETKRAKIRYKNNKKLIYKK